MHWFLLDVAALQANVKFFSPGGGLMQRLGFDSFCAAELIVMLQCQARIT